jgi:hypothetical protein
MLKGRVLNTPNLASKASKRSETYSPNDAM